MLSRNSGSGYTNYRHSIIEASTLEEFRTSLARQLVHACQEETIVHSFIHDFHQVLGLLAAVLPPYPVPQDFIQKKKKNQSCGG